MAEKDKIDEEIQRQYNKIMFQAARQIFLVPIILILLIIGAATDNWKISEIGVVPIIAYMGWFNLVRYRCPKCGHLFNRYQIYTDECKKCHTKFYKK